MIRGNWVTLSAKYNYSDRLAHISESLNWLKYSYALNAWQLVFQLPPVKRDIILFEVVW